MLLWEGRKMWQQCKVSSHAYSSSRRRLRLRSHIHCRDWFYDCVIVNRRYLIFFLYQWNNIKCLPFSRRALALWWSSEPQKFISSRERSQNSLTETFINSVHGRTMKIESVIFVLFENISSRLAINDDDEAQWKLKIETDFFPLFFHMTECIRASGELSFIEWFSVPAVWRSLDAGTSEWWILKSSNFETKQLYFCGFSVWLTCRWFGKTIK